MNTALRLVPDTIFLPGKHDYINKMSSNEPKCGILFSDFITTTIEKKARRMGMKYKNNYITLINHLVKFMELNEAIIYTNSINEEFLDDFIIYLEDQNLRLTYIKNLIGLVKSMIKKAGSYGYAVDSTWDDVTVEDEEIYSVYLSLNEITRIYYFKGLTKKQERIRDLFVVGCLTALRYSDYSTLTRQNFVDDQIVKVTKKTGKKVILPIHDYIKEIYTKYDGEISSGLTNQHFNRYIKKICKIVGINDLITYNYTKGGKLITQTKEKWEMISSHTARRSAATNMYITGRFKTFEIMSLTGHTTEKSFFRYIRVTHEDTARQIAGDNFFRK